MRKYLPEFDYIEPRSLSEVLDALNSFKQEVKVIAGGTDLVTAMREKGLKPKYILSFKNVRDELDYIEFDDKSQVLRIGALTTIHSIETSDILKGKFYVLREAAAQLGSYQIRNLATIGGNLCNASPAADMAPPLMALNSKLVLLSSGGEREIPVEGFFVGPGETILTNDEILKEIIVPEPTGMYGCSFLKISRRMIGLAIVNVATFVKLKDKRLEEVRISLGAVAPTPVRARNLEKELIGKEIDELDLSKVCETVEGDINPISDVRASLEYRKHLAKVLTARSLRISIERAMSR
jgi:carbon-monoxide dehydrogenase medium subunit